MFGQRGFGGGLAIWHASDFAQGREDKIGLLFIGRKLRHESQASLAIGKKASQGLLGGAASLGFELRENAISIGDIFICVGCHSLPFLLFSYA